MKLGDDMFYITGDTHGDFTRIYDFCEFTKTTQKDDVMIVLGDAGINYFLDDQDYWLKEELTLLPITLFCIHGNHEERPYNIPTYIEKEWNGGSVYYEEDYPNILFAKDGEIYNLDGKRTLVIGGAYSIDKFARIRSGRPWFESEQPDEKVKAHVEECLRNANWEVDYVLSHTCPRRYEPVEEFMFGVKQWLVDKKTENWLDEIVDKLTFERWYFGHFHCYKVVGRAKILYKDIERFV